MRKSLILMLIATLLVGAILVSCNSDISSESSNGDKLVEISISGNDKGISAIATADNADDYYWYYTATKADNSVYRTGQTANWTPIKKAGETNDNFTAGLTGRSLGYFSKGDWKFSFRAYSTKQTSFSDDGFAYYQNDLGVKVEDSTKYVTVTVKESSLAANADVVFNTLNWKYTPENNTEFDETLSYLNGKEVYMFFAYSVDGVNYTSLARSKGTVYTFDGSDKKMGDEGFAFPGIFAKAEFTSFYKYEDSDYSSTATDVKLPASVSGKALTLKYWVETVPVGNVGAEEIGTPSFISVTAYSGGKVTVSVDSTGVAVSGNEHLEEVIIDKGVISVVATKEDQTFTVKDAGIPTSSRVSNADAIVFETQVTGVSAEESTSDKKTTVTFPADSLITSNANTSTDVDVSMEFVVYQTETAAANSTFKVSSGNTFAGLDLSVDLITTTVSGTEETTTTEPVSSFNNQAVTVTTYIAKGLTNVIVEYPTTGNEAQPIASSIASEITAKKAHIYADDTLLGENLGYSQETGKLRFTTTHFSSFAVGADQNVYDKTSNTGYRIGTTADGEAKEGLLLDAENDVVAANNNHEYLLLDASKANDVADSIDAFNANIKWSAVHAANDTPSELFAGGYGTKVEPYLIASVDNFKKINNVRGYYSYFKVKDGVTSLNLDNIGMYVSMNGSFNGNRVQFTNVSGQMFGKVGTGEDIATNAVVIQNFTVNYTGGFGIVAACGAKTLSFKEITVAGYCLQDWNSAAFLRYGSANASNNGFNYTVNFVECSCNAEIYTSQNSYGAILIGNSYPGTGYTATINVDTYTDTNINPSILYWTGGNGKYGKKYYGMGNSVVYVNGTQTDQNTITGDNVVAVTTGKNPAKDSNRYTITPESDTSKIVARILWQYTEHTENYDSKIPNLNGVGGTIGQLTFDVTNTTNPIELLGSITSVEIVTGNVEWTYTLEDGNLKLYTPTNNTFIDGTVSLHVDQFVAGTNVAKYKGSLILATKDKAANWDIK